MDTVVDLAAKLRADPNLSEAELEQVLILSDASNHRRFLSGDGVKDAVKQVSELFVTRYFNNADPNVVPIRRKTKFVLVLNNFALNKALRAIVLDALKLMDGIFEESMKKEGAMPFDSELGRMSEHVLVLLMRCLNYKLKAAQVHEFAEFNTQFAVQLLLAILLKEPPYEFELRCNCISGLLGFTQPQAFFQATDKIELQTCDKFNQKVDFIANLMLRLSAVHVVNDVITCQMIESPTVTPAAHLAVMNMMRCIMNIFQFVSTGAAQWRQHVLLSTSFLDSTTLLYLQLQTKTLENSFVSTSGVANVPQEVITGITTALKFLAFATFHMGRHAQCIRPLCAFAHDLLHLPMRVLFSNDKLAPATVNLYAQLFHALSNIDALGSEEGIVEDPSDLLPELTSAELRRSIYGFLKAEVASLGNAALDKLAKKFGTVDTGALVAHDSATFQAIDAIFAELASQSAPHSPAAAAPEKKSLLGDIPSLAKSAPEKKIAAPAAPVEIKQNFVAPKNAGAVTDKYACALNGHTMKVPVTSPYGHTFEKETIEQWIKQQGSVCPITGKPLSLEDLKPNKALQNEIMQLIIQQSMVAANHEDDMDLYDF